MHHPIFLIRVKNLEEDFVNYSSDMTKIAEMVYGVRDEVINLDLSMIAEEWEFYDEKLRTNKQLRKGWYIDADEDHIV